MDKDKSELEKFMGDLGGGGDKDPLQDKGEDPFGHLEEKEEGIVDEPKDEKPLPFNKDPKVQKFIDKEISKRMAEYKPEVKEPEQKGDESDDDYYARLIGNDTPERIAMQKEYKAREERLLQKAEERAYNRLTSEQRREVEADQKAEQELESAFENIEETFSVDITSNNPVARKTRQEFVSFVEKLAPKDSNGDIVDYPDMVSAFETFSAMKKATATPSRAKELAAQGMRRSVETSSEPNIPRSRTPFASSDEFIASLSK